MFRVLRSNLRHVLPEADSGTLDRLAQKGVALAFRTYYETFRSAATRRPAAQIEMDVDCCLARWKEPSSASPGLVIGGLHMSNFDIAGAHLAHLGYDIQVLSLADPDAGTQCVNDLRRSEGLHVTPIEPKSLRAAINRLKHGGIVLTGVDRPLPDSGAPVSFFGQRALMPEGHVRLALQTGASFMLMACLEVAPGLYRVIYTPPRPLATTGDRTHDIETNTRAILTMAEEFISRAPEQWLVFVPVWPDHGQDEPRRAAS